MDAHDPSCCAKNWPAARVFLLLTWQADALWLSYGCCSGLLRLLAARREHVKTKYQARNAITQDRGVLGWPRLDKAPARRAARDYGAALPRERYRAVGRECSVADAVHELVAAVRAAHRLGRFRLVGQLLGLVAALEEAR